MNLFEAIILGIVEGITEFLPISSTGHLILAGKLLSIPENSFVSSFEIAIQSGAILAVVFLYWHKIKADKEIWKYVFSAFLPTAIVGVIFYKTMKSFLMSSSLVILWALFLGGIVLIFFELWYFWFKRKKRNFILKQDELTFLKALAIGAVQSLAIIPGVSRAGATIVAGLLMGLSRHKIVEFSFLLAVPTIAGATIYDLWKNAIDFSLNQFHLLAVGFIVSFFTAALTIKWFLSFVQRHTFIFFGFYRIIAALLFWFFIIR